MRGGMSLFDWLIGLAVAAIMLLLILAQAGCAGGGR